MVQHVPPVNWFTSGFIPGTQPPGPLGRFGFIGGGGGGF